MYPSNFLRAPTYARRDYFVVYMSICISEYYVHDEKIGKICKHIVINSGKRTLKIIRIIIVGRMLVLTLDDHVVHANASIHHLPRLLLRPSDSGISQ
jgi:hypothetical protein